MNRQDYERIQELIRTIRHSTEELQALLRTNDIPADLMEPINNLLRDAERHAKQHVIEVLRFALARINLRDETYQVIRVIDGDTLEVLPPEELQDWMRDVHIRLYGIDAPEQSERLGPVFTGLLERLCSLNEGRVRIIWERERAGTEYEGFPRTSFERGIGHVFIDVLPDHVLYVNSLLAMFRDVSIQGRQKPLIRGARIFPDVPRLSRYQWRCREKLSESILNALDGAIDTADAQMEGNPFPICLCLFPKSVVTASAEDVGRVCEIVSGNLRERGCPYSYASVLEDRWSSAAREGRASPFDVPILLASTREVTAPSTSRLASS